MHSKIGRFQLCPHLRCVRPVGLRGSESVEMSSILGLARAAAVQTWCAELQKVLYRTRLSTFYLFELSSFLRSSNFSLGVIGGAWGRLICEALKLRNCHTFRPSDGSTGST